MKIINHDLILTEVTIFNESIKVIGDIKGNYNLIIYGNIDARDINAWNIDAGNINAWNIDAKDIDARDIVCENRVKKSKTAKTICRVYAKNRSQLERKERDLE